MKGIPIAVSLLLLLPLFFVRIPPSADLPQHMAQIRLMLDSRQLESGGMEVHWTAPNTLVYSLAAGAWAIAGPERSGRVLLGVLILLWSVAIFLLAKRVHAPPENAILAALLVYNHSLYWGFVNFLCGFPIFIGFYLVATREHPKTNRIVRLATLSLLASLLLWAHVLWFAVGAMWYGMRELWASRPIVQKAYRLSALSPAALLAAVWYPSLSALRAGSGFSMEAQWDFAPWEKLAPQALVNSIFGGLKGPFEPLAALFLAAWIVLALRPWSPGLRRRIQIPLMIIALMFMGIAILAPDKFQNTIFFGWRWMPCGVAILLLSLPSPFARKGQALAVALAALVIFLGFSIRAWTLFESRELDGFEEAIGALPDQPVLVGLDYVKNSRYIKWRPFLQLFALGQVLKGGRLNFSFVEHGSGLVVNRAAQRSLWTGGLEWWAERFRLSDLRYFNAVLVHGDEEIHAQFSARPELELIEGRGRWRLYRPRPLDTSAAGKNEGGASR